MYGRTIGTLNLYQVVGQTETLIWTLSGDKGNSWFSGQVPVGKKLFNGYKVCQNHVVWNKRTSYSFSFEKNREGSFIWLFSHRAMLGMVSHHNNICICDAYFELDSWTWYSY